jgi:adenosylcobinamide-GDP ribazoletransferase
MPVAELRGLAAAVAFLTRVPIGRLIVLDGADVARAGVGFPLVGAAIGGAVGGIAAALQKPLTPLIAAGIALAVGALLTGALHLDALADTADALAARTRARALEIMRDHAIGAYGATALVLDLVIKAAALATLAEHRHVIAPAVAAAGAARAVPVGLAAALPYARERGTGAALATAPAWRAAVACGLALGIALAVAGRDGAVIAAVAAAVAGGAALACRRWLGGVTGDTLGASAEVAELAGLVAAVALVT